jgi:hypothetical protein
MDASAGGASHGLKRVLSAVVVGLVSGIIDPALYGRAGVWAAVEKGRDNRMIPRGKTACEGACATGHRLQLRVCAVIIARERGKLRPQLPKHPKPHVPAIAALVARKTKGVNT